MYLMANSADPDQKPTDLDLHCLQKQDISGFSRTRVKRKFLFIVPDKAFFFFYYYQEVLISFLFLLINTCCG